MKSKEELNALKEEVETLNKKLAELSDEELAQVTGGATTVILDPKISIKISGNDNSTSFGGNVLPSEDTAKDGSCGSYVILKYGKCLQKSSSTVVGIADPCVGCKYA